MKKIMLGGLAAAALSIGMCPAHLGQPHLIGRAL